MSHFKYICAFKGSDNNAPAAGSRNPLNFQDSGVTRENAHHL